MCRDPGSASGGEHMTPEEALRYLWESTKKTKSPKRVCICLAVAILVCLGDRQILVMVENEKNAGK